MILIKTININDLFNNTLVKAPDIFDYTTDRNGINLGLKYRYEFINFWLKKNKQLNLDDIKESDYYKLISKPINNYPRDGGKKWIYKDPLEQTNRFLELTKSILNDGYINEDYSIKLKKFENKVPIHVSIDEDLKITKIKYRNIKFLGLIEVIKYKNIFIVFNGHHRLAILKSFLDNKVINNEKILVKYEKIYLFERIYFKILSIFNKFNLK